MNSHAFPLLRYYEIEKYHHGTFDADCDYPAAATGRGSPFHSLGIGGYIPYITHFDAPELLEANSSLRFHVEAALIFHGKQHPYSPKASRLFTAFLLVVDKAAREYSAGRELLVAYASSSNNTKLFIDGLGRYETCVTTTKRAFRLFDRIKNEREIPSVERLTRNLALVYDKHITDIRDAIEHIDGDIVKGELADGEPHLLLVDKAGTQLELGGYALTFAALHSAIVNLHRAGAVMIEALPATTRTDA